MRAGPPCPGLPRSDRHRPSGASAGGCRAVLDAIGTLYVLYSPDVYTALTEDLRWSIEHYERWLAEMLYRTVMS